mgnify:CR=1 FL=1
MTRKMTVTEIPVRVSRLGNVVQPIRNVSRLVMNLSADLYLFIVKLASNINELVICTEKMILVVLLYSTGIRVE